MHPAARALVVTFVLAAYVAGTALGAAPTTAPSAVTVTHNKPKVTTRTFDPKRPPSDMPPLAPNEAALCQSRFGCGVVVEVDIRQAADEKPTMTIASMKVDLTLDITVWLPSGATAKIRSHENAHRQVSEHFYKDAGTIARKIAEKYVGKRLDIDSIDRQHTQPVIQKAANEFAGEYMGQTQVPMEKAQKRFDELTDHGRNNLSEKEAIRRALAGN